MQKSKRSRFLDVESLLEDSLFGLRRAFYEDTRPFKVDLGIGTYRNREGNFHLLQCVKLAIKSLFDKRKDCEYLPILGDNFFIKKVESLLFGEGIDCGVSFQSLGGTGALFVLAEILKKFGIKKIYLSYPTWSNHEPLLRQRDFAVESYPYFDVKGILKAFSLMDRGSGVVLQPSCHNPTGFFLLKEVWDEIFVILEEREIFPLFDCAYAGLGTSFDEDVWPIRQCVKKDIECMVAFSFSKNMGLHGERVGIGSVVTFQKKLFSHVEHMIRTCYSTPPRFGMEIVLEILNREELFFLWQEELAEMRIHLQQSRSLLEKALYERQCRCDLSSQEGVFAFLGLDELSVQWLKEKRAVYVAPLGRLNVSGISEKNREYVADSLAEVMR